MADFISLLLSVNQVIVAYGVNNSDSFDRKTAAERVFDE